MLIEFSIVPIGTSSSLSARVAEVLDIVDSSGLPYKLTPMGTIVEGEWNELMRLVRECHRKMMKNEERVLTSILIDDRKGKTGRMDRKIRSVEKRLGRSLKK
ncbi:MAG: putative cytosolic protein [Nitrospirae bacterium]|nr:putative cytosolic protein [Nitrospirota bacterium]